MNDTRSGDPTILVVEDDEATCDFLQELLGLAGYTVVVATTGAAGLKHAGTAPLPLIILDRRLTDKDGLQVSANMRNELGLTMPILLLTADHDPDLDRAAHAVGVTAVLRKPFDPAVLLEHVTELVQPARTAQAG